MDLVKKIDLSSLLETLPKKWTPATATLATLTGLYFLWRLKRQLYKKNISGQTVLITGGAMGLGRRLSYEFAALGCRIVLWDINAQGLEAVEKELKEKNVAFVKTYVVDLSKKEAIYATADKVKAECGNIDIIVNNAGIVTGKPFLECTDEQIERTMAVNINAHFWIAKSFLPAMIAAKRGHLVTIASMAGHAATRSLADYSASKFAAVGFDEALRTELSSSNIQTTCVCPYYINTGMFDGVKSQFPLLPILDERYVAKRIINAVLVGDEVIMLPFLASLLPSVRLFPVPIQDLIFRFVGITETMKTFKGRQPAASATPSS